MTAKSKMVKKTEDINGLACLFPSKTIPEIILSGSDILRHRKNSSKVQSFLPDMYTSKQGCKSKRKWTEGNG
jgi:hypothetical protein